MSKTNGKLVLKTIEVLEDAAYDEKAFRKLKLTHEEYQSARTTLKEYWRDGEAQTFNSSVADFFKRNGFSVSKADDGVDYIITSEVSEDDD